MSPLLLVVYVCVLHTTVCDVALSLPQLVEVDDGGMWVMEETTGGSSSGPPKTGHKRQKEHAQQSTVCSSERSAKLPRLTGMVYLKLCVIQ